ncbi:MAG: glycosyltransferase family 2 protein [Oscillospiraceae bacterium]|nr:glycosyltransferase family 2 protein [Oscillospiraceae bacterium]
MMSFVSVIIPCYNAEGYIEKCLSALAAQTFRDFEVIVVDDCSTDNTKEVIWKYQKNAEIQIALLENTVNAGPGVSRNKGIQYAKSEYVCFCDSDDWYDPDYLEKMVQASYNGQADMVFCNARKIIAGKGIEMPMFGNMSEQVSVQEVLVLGIDSLWCTMIRRNIAATVSQPALRNGEDMAVIPLMIMQCRRFGFVQMCIYNYLCRPGSLSLAANKGVVKSLEDSFWHIRTNCPEGHEKEIEFIGIKNLVYGGLLNHFKAKEDSLTARQLLERFEKYYPHWYTNPYCKDLPIFKRAFLFFAKMRWFIAVHLMCLVHKSLTERE